MTARLPAPKWVSRAFPELHHSESNTVLLLQRESLESRGHQYRYLMVLAYVARYISIFGLGFSALSPSRIMLAFFLIVVPAMSLKTFHRAVHFRPARIHRWDMQATFRPNRFAQPIATDLHAAGISGPEVAVALLHWLIRVPGSITAQLSLGFLLFVIPQTFLRVAPLSIVTWTLVVSFALCTFASDRLTYAMTISTFAESVLEGSLLHSLIDDPSTRTIQRHLAASRSRDHLMRLVVSFTVAVLAVAWLLCSFWIEIHLNDLASWKKLPPFLFAFADHPLATTLALLLLGLACILEVVQRLVVWRLSRLSRSFMARAAIIFDANFADPKDPDSWRWALWFHDPQRDPAATTPESQAGWTPAEAAQRLLSAREFKTDALPQP